MPIGTITVTLYTCSRTGCGHRWLPRDPLAEEAPEPPKVCPKCKNPNWNRPPDTTIPAAKKASKKRAK
jgi:hypothetical protein